MVATRQELSGPTSLSSLLPGAGFATTEDLLLDAYKQKSPSAGHREEGPAVAVDRRTRRALPRATAATSLQRALAALALSEPRPHAETYWNARREGYRLICKRRRTPRTPQAVGLAYEPRRDPRDPEADAVDLSDATCPSPAGWCGAQAAEGRGLSRPSYHRGRSRHQVFHGRGGKAGSGPESSSSAEGDVTRSSLPLHDPAVDRVCIRIFAITTHGPLPLRAADCFWRTCRPIGKYEQRPELDYSTGIRASRFNHRRSRRARRMTSTVS